MNVIEIEGLRKSYRKLRGGTTTALTGLDLTVEEGGVFGFLGPNGSGKTTTIRCLLGLVRPSAGTCRLFERDVRTDLAPVIGRVGSLVESPALFPTFTARKNLSLLAGISAIPNARVDEVLELVGLTDRAGDAVKGFSLGMRQRLAIAAALLKDPELLILDEPANGLDPAGIKEVRELLKTIGAQGRTVFVSSHQLVEIQQVCDRVAIMARGKAVTSGPVDEVLARGRSTSMLVRVDQPMKALNVLERAGMSGTLSDGSLRIQVGPDNGALISKILAQHELYPNELRPDGVDLETVFLELTEEVEAA